MGPRRGRMQGEPAEPYEPGSLRELSDPFVELFERRCQLLLARLVRRQLELPLHFGSRETERFELPRLLRIPALGGLTGSLFLLFAFFHALGEAGFRVDEAFSGVTHIQ